MRGFLLPLLGATFASACRTGGGAAAPPRDTRAVLIRLEAHLAALVDAGDTTGIDALLAPDFALVGLDTTRRVARQTWISNTARLSFDSVGATVTDVAARGDSARVVLSLRFRIAGPGVAPARELCQFADVWVRRDAAWRLSRRRLLGCHTSPG